MMRVILIWLVSGGALVATQELDSERIDLGTWNAQLVLANVLNVRKGPSLSDPVVTRLERGDWVCVREEGGAWLPVRLPPDTSDDDPPVDGDAEPLFGYVHRGFITSDASDRPGHSEWRSRCRSLVDTTHVGAE